MTFCKIICGENLFGTPTPKIPTPTKIKIPQTSTPEMGLLNVLHKPHTARKA
ncbi:hypothetical protein VPHK45_0015 [Vibrio phage K45]